MNEQQKNWLAQMYEPTDYVNVQSWKFLWYVYFKFENGGSIKFNRITKRWKKSMVLEVDTDSFTGIIGSSGE